jgi:hypothetical protein
MAVCKHLECMAIGVCMEMHLIYQHKILCVLDSGDVTRIQRFCVHTHICNKTGLYNIHVLCSDSPIYPERNGNVLSHRKAASFRREMKE